MNHRCSHPSVSILLASHNGSKYIYEQLESIRKQNFGLLNIIVCDDHSTDNTIEKIEFFKDKHTDLQIKIFHLDTLNGHVNNFKFLCELALKESSEYYCFSDQDDYWKSDKILESYNAAQDLDKKIPFLVHSDLTVTNDNLEIIAHSFVQYQGLPDPNKQDMTKLFMQNIATGCTFFFNRALLEVAYNFPNRVTNHDWWFALCAYSFGHIVFINKPLVFYRQHASNTLGAISKKDDGHKLTLTKKIKIKSKYPRLLSNSIVLAQSLLQISTRHKISIRPETLSLLKEISCLKESSVGQIQKWIYHNISKANTLKYKTYSLLLAITVKFL